ncbi:hypothetical protein KP509_06G005800 [Ceratopteris richardii]|uniref:Protein RIK n=1 Tax=Ceratopteris richardii TaxID=49495 RepID=A0A8T2UDX7_CERRI|nr:hypothetical protein KP509_06G005800 [Ceratopteris richardii]
MAEEVKVEANTEPSTRQRKKRKWDQPAENILAASAGAAGFMPTAALTGINLPGIFPSSMGVYPTMSASTACAQMPFMFSTVQQSAAAIIQKINQDLVAKGVAPINKIQDEMIAREIVINDADAAVRYKLTKRQTQEEIQAKTGAVVITRGKYKPPNGTVDHEKPLYLHISAGAHLKDTAERVKAVDQAAALIDEMLKQGRQVPVSAVNGQVGTNSPLTAVVFVDFEADTSVDLISRIRGSNDQYINHIMHETGATVLVKGGACEISCIEEIPQPLHLFISAEHPKSLEDAKRLSEHLLETIRSEIAGARPPYFVPPVSYNLQQLPQAGSSLASVNVSLPQLSAFSIIQSTGSISAGFSTSDSTVRLGSLQNYSAVPPPKQLLTTDNGSDKMANGQTSVVPLSSGMAVSNLLAPFTGHFPAAYATAPLSQALTQQTYGVYPQASRGSEQYPSYSAYSGLYPQASPLQQVALALQRPAFSQGSDQSSSSITFESTKSLTNASSNQKQAEKQEKQRRKFQEGPSLKRDQLADQALAAKQAKQVGTVETSASMGTLPPKTVSAPSLRSLKSPLPSASMLPPGAVPSSTSPKTSIMPPPSMIPSSPIPKSVSRPSSVGSKSPPAAGDTITTLTTGTSTFPLPVKLKEAHVETPGIKLVEYGEDDEDDDDDDEENENDNARSELLVNELIAKPYVNGKPFWAV